MLQIKKYLPNLNVSEVYQITKKVALHSVWERGGEAGGKLKRFRKVSRAAYITLRVTCGPQAAGCSITDLQDVSECFNPFFSVFLLYWYGIVSCLVCLGNML